MSPAEPAPLLIVATLGVALHGGVRDGRQPRGANRHGHAACEQGADGRFSRIPMGQSFQLPIARAERASVVPRSERELVQREAVIGVALDAWMLVPRWVRGETTPDAAGVTLDTVADHIEHIGQLAGNARHCAIGSDLDGAFGREQCPSDVHTIADLSRLPSLLASRGYTEGDVAQIAHGNVVRFLREAWG